MMMLSLLQCVRTSFTTTSLLHCHYHPDPTPASLDGRGVSPPDANSREISPEKIEEDAARAVALERENRKRRSLEEKMAKERVQKHLESLRSKQKVREEEVK